MSHYKQLSSGERGRIVILRQAGFSVSTIAMELGRDPSTISREVRRNRELKAVHQTGAGALILLKRRSMTLRAL